MTAALDCEVSGNDAQALRASIVKHLVFSLGQDAATARPEDWLHAAVLAVRDRLVERWRHTKRAQNEQEVKRVYYLSMEFLMGRAFDNALLALGLREPLRQALSDLGAEIDLLAALEPDAALGSGGLGRLAACFLDSMATLGIAGCGYGIRYDCGMFRQAIVEGQQVEWPDDWLAHGNPWEFPRPEVSYPVQFGGHVTQQSGRSQWVSSETMRATAYDILVPGYGTDMTNTLRLWSARASEAIDLGAFNRGDHGAAVERKNRAENVSRVLYPDDSTPAGRELRLRQEYFFVSASVQDLLRRHIDRYTDYPAGFERLPERVSIHLNDTHPVLAIPELMRLLLDAHGLGWADAWRLCQGLFSYTNHTLLHEALETWPLELLGRLLPRHLQIIFDINSHFLQELTRSRGHDVELMRRVSLIDENGERRVRMAHLAVVGSHSVNGVSALHTELMQRSICADFAALWPERFNNKTNGITPRRWLAQANPALSALLDRRLGTGWRRDLSEFARLKPLAQDASLRQDFIAAKRANKQRLADWLARALGIEVSTEALFDVQVKRIHEYKRQLLNLLQVVSRYLRLLDDPGAVAVPRVVLFAGKAASSYQAAKQIIRLINDVAATVNADPRIGDRLKVIFVPNYGVSLAELIIPAADLSEQLSTAGTEASGTGNMKLALNGALTIGTLDGANVEICDQVGAENMFIFGHTTSEVQALRTAGYQPRAWLERSPNLGRVLAAIRDGRFSPTEPGRHQALCDSLVNWDHYLLLADYERYLQAQDAVDRAYQNPPAWAGRAIANVAGMGRFSSDRTVAEYARDIWGCAPLRLSD